MKLLVDNQLPVALSRFLASHGCDCVHVIEAGMGNALDAEIWRHACENRQIVITKDEDFIYLSKREPEQAGVIWVRMGNCRTAALLAKFARLWPRIQASVEAGERIIEVR
ncbi:MAG: DUF5615 family PIN-like protein [Terriglobia bacterium]